MTIRWHTDMVRPEMGGAVGNGGLHARGSAHYLAGFDLCPAQRARRRIGDRALLGDSRSRPHLRFEKGELARSRSGSEGGVGIGVGSWGYGEFLWSHFDKFPQPLTSVAGMLITSLAGRYGVQKTGKLGVGAKSILSFLVVGWVLFGILYASMMQLPTP